MHADIQMNFKCIILSEGSQTQKTMFYAILKKAKQNSGCRDREGWRRKN